MKFIVIRNQEQFGPFSLNQLQAIVNDGYFQLTDLCWAEGWSEWKLLSAVVSRIPDALQNVIPENLENILDENNLSPIVSDDKLIGILSNPPKIENLSVFPIENQTDNNLRAGMVVKNESQGVSCDFVTSLAVRGIFVKPSPNIEMLLKDQEPSIDVAFHIARGEEVIGFYPIKDILSYLETGLLLPTDLFWNQSVEDWQEVSQIYTH